MKKTKILEVTQIDLIGKRYNGYDMIHDLDSKKYEIKQAVIEKLSNDKNVINLLHNTGEQIIMEKCKALEEKLSIKNVISITSPILLKQKEYKEADIIHFHQFHNANLSLPFLRIFVTVNVSVNSNSLSRVSVTALRILLIFL